MRVTYHTYWLKDLAEKKIYKFNLRPLLNQLQNEPLKLRKSFIENETEALYLVQERAKTFPNTFFFMITRDDEIIKTIDDKLTTIEDLTAKVAANNEKIVTGAFLYLNTVAGLPFIGFCSQLLSPRIDRFWYFINNYLEKLGLSKDYEIIGRPIQIDTEINDFMKMEFIGKTHIELSGEHPLFSDILTYFSSGLPEDAKEVNGIEITIKANRGKNVKAAVSKLPKIVEQEGVVKLTARAKAEMQSALTDIYVVGHGVLGHEISPEDKNVSNVTYEIENKVQNNVLLNERLSRVWRENGNSGELTEDILDKILIKSKE